MKEPYVQGPAGPAPFGHGRQRGIAMTSSMKLGQGRCPRDDRRHRKIGRVVHVGGPREPARESLRPHRGQPPGERCDPLRASRTGRQEHAGPRCGRGVRRAHRNRLRPLAAVEMGGRNRGRAPGHLRTGPGARTRRHPLRRDRLPGPVPRVGRCPAPEVHGHTAPRPARRAGGAGRGLRPRHDQQAGRHRPCPPPTGPLRPGRMDGSARRAGPQGHLPSPHGGAEAGRRHQPHLRRSPRSRDGEPTSSPIAPQGAWPASSSEAIVRSQVRCWSDGSTRTSQASGSSIRARSC